MPKSPFTCLRLINQPVKKRVSVHHQPCIMKSKRQRRPLFLAKQCIALLDRVGQQNLAGGIDKTGQTVADPVPGLSIHPVKGCNTHTSCGLYVCQGTGPIGR
jgi:hypothetical protein